MKTAALDQLLGCYFHQDWRDEYIDETAALNAIVEDVSNEYLDKGIFEIQTVLSTRLGENELGALLVEKVGCYFAPSSENLTYREWLQRVQNFFKMHVHQRAPALRIAPSASEETGGLHESRTPCGPDSH